MIFSYLIFVGIVISMFIATLNMKGNANEKSNRD